MISHGREDNQGTFKTISRSTRPNPILELQDKYLSTNTTWNTMYHNANHVSVNACISDILVNYRNKDTTSLESLYQIRIFFLILTHMVDLKLDLMT